MTGGIFDTGVLSAAEAANLEASLAEGAIVFAKRAIDFNAANNDNAIPIALPTGFTRYRILNALLNGASVSITTATCGLFTAPAGAGTAIVANATAITVSSAAEITNNNMQNLTVANGNTMSINAAILYFRTVTAQGVPATGNLTLIIQPLS